MRRFADSDTIRRSYSIAQNVDQGWDYRFDNFGRQSLSLILFSFFFLFLQQTSRVEMRKNFSIGVVEIKIVQTF